MKTSRPTLRVPSGHSAIFIIAALLCGIGSTASAQDNIHYIPPNYIRTADNNSLGGSEELHLSTNVATPFVVTISQGDGTVLATRTISQNSPQSYTVNTGNGLGVNLIGTGQLNTVLANEGLIVSASQPFFCNMRYRNSPQGGSLTCKGKAAFGKEFRTGHVISNQASPAPGLDNRKNHYIAVMATQDNTLVEFSDFKAGVTAFMPGVSGPVGVTLNRGESYVIGLDHTAQNVAIDGINGTRVSATKDVVVTSGSWLNGNLQSSAGRDIGIDQLVPIDRLPATGEWVVFNSPISTSQSPNLERPMVLALEDACQVFVNGSATPFTTLANAGDFVFLPRTSYDANGIMYITTDRKAALFHNTNGSPSSTGPSLGIVPSLPCASSDRLEIPEAQHWGDATTATHISIVTRTGASLTVLSNGTPVAPTSFAVTGTAAWRAHKFSFTTTASTRLEITSDAQYVVTLNAGAGARGATGTYTGFSRAPIIVSPFSDPSATVSYPVTLTLSETNGYNAGQFQWFLNGVAIAGAVNDTYVATGPGVYTVTGTSATCGVSPQATDVVLPGPIDVEIEAGLPTQVNDTQYDIPYRVTVENRTGGAVNNVQAVADLQVGMAPLGVAQWTISSAPTGSGDFAAGEGNAAFDGETAGDRNLLDAGVNLADGERGVLEFTVRVTTTTGTPTGTSTVTATEGSGTFSDNDSTPTPPIYALNVETSVAAPVKVAGTAYTFDLTYTVTATNNRSERMAGLQLVQDLQAAFAPLPSSAWSIQSAPAGTGAFAGAGFVNGSYTGLTAGDRNLLQSGVDLAAGATGTLTYTIRIDLSSGFPTAALSVQGTAAGFSDDSDDNIGAANLTTDGPDSGTDPADDPTPFRVPDTDGDGVRDDVDIDDDNDGIRDVDEENGTTNRDTDGDGLFDRLDRDSDNDGNPDSREAGFDFASQDADSDGEVNGPFGADGFDDTLGNASALNYTIRNSDGFGLPDFQDLDSDDDGIPDVKEYGGTAADANNDAILDGATSDADGDGLANAVDPDDDGPTSGSGTTGTAVTLTNSDGDPVPDWRDLDADNDGVPDLWEKGDSAATDVDQNGYLDGGDADSDGIRDSVDRNDGAFGSPTTPIPAPVDTAGGAVGVPDFQTIDSDGAGLTDRQVWQLPTGAGTPDAGGVAGRIDNEADSDGDGIPTSVDRKSAGPGSFFGFPEVVDTDNDGVPNKDDIDDDNDGILDTAEENGTPNRDTDGDGVVDRLDLDSDNDGNPDSREAGFALTLDPDANGEVNGPFGATGFATSLDAGGGTTNYTLRNSDGAELPDFQDLDADNDGITDIKEYGGASALDANNDGILDASSSDTDGDGLANGVDPLHDGPNASATTAPAAGVAVTLTNSDGDATQDWRDLDSDNDGVPDLIESGDPLAVDLDGDGYLDGTDTDSDGIRDSVDRDDGPFGSPTGIPNPVDSAGGQVGADFRVLDSNGGPVDRIDYALPTGAGTPDVGADGRIDATADADNDGIVDTVDRKSAAPGAFFGYPEILDHDRDGILDRTDIDDDNDGIRDVDEDAGLLTRDTDGDGLLDRWDRDSDNDGNPDSREAGFDFTTQDADNDGEVDGPFGADGFDDTLGTAATLNYTLRNSDGTSRPDFQDLDSDDDGISDIKEYGGASAADANRDAILDGANNDSDGDGLANGVDPDHDGPNFQVNPAPGAAGVAVTLVNSDGDATQDWRDVDSDNDGVADLVENGNPSAVDSNGDGLLDGADTDQDGIADSVDGSATFGSGGTPLPDPVDSAGGSVGADFRVLDSDGGPVDRIDYGLPTGAGTPDVGGDGLVDATADSDNDGIVDTVDRKSAGPGAFYGFPESVDPDGDGVTNKADLDDDNDAIRDTDEQAGTPNRDTDGDGIPDHLDLDSDGDGIPDLRESGVSAALLATLDTDNDGDVDSAVGTNGLADAAESAPGSGTLGYTISNVDGLGRPDFQDRDADSDGITDTFEGRGADADGDGVVDGATTDSDRDGIVDSVDPAHDGPNATIVTAPAPGTRLPVPDTDGDSVPDYRDLDADNDGIPDVTEAGGTDADGDAILDGAAADGDGDGLADSVDGAILPLPDTDSDGRRNYVDLDSDNDGLSDLEESGNPSALDVDRDGVLDAPDADGDGIRDSVDGNDGAFGSSGTAIPTAVDTAGGAAGVPDYLALDSDGDGTPDRIEAGLPSGPGTADSNSDGRIDNAADSDNDGIPDVVDRSVGTFGGVESSVGTEFSFSQRRYPAAEDAGTVTITVVRATTSTTGTVDFRTEDDEALAGSDYQATSGTLSFAVGEASKTFTVAVSDDALLEGEERVRLRLTDGGGTTLDLAALVIGPQRGIQITTTALPGGGVGAPYAEAIDLDDGGLGPPFAWRVVKGQLPPGLALDGAGRSVLLGGTPTTAGSYTFTVEARDTLQALSVDTQELTVTISAPNPGSNPEIGPRGPQSLLVGQPLDQPFGVSGGQGPYSWSVASGALPPGLVLDPISGRIVGTPSGSGTFTLCLQVTDSAGKSDTTGDGSCPAGEELTFTVGPAPVQIETSSVPDAALAAPYSERLEASGGVGPGYTWSVSAGTLPPGISLSGSGLFVTLAGTPTTPGNYEFTVQVADDGQGGGVTDTQAFLIRVPTINAGDPTITTLSVPKGTINQGYSAKLNAIGGTPGYTFNLEQGELPTGLVLSSDGSISGSSNQPGTKSFQAKVTDSTGKTALRSYTLTIESLPQIVPPVVTSGLVGAGYGLSLEGILGVGPYEWSLVSGGATQTGDLWTDGGLPPGLGLSANSGTIAGTPTTAGSYTFTVRLTDARGATAERQVTIVIEAAPGAQVLVLTRNLPRGESGQPYAAPLLATGGTGPYTWALSEGRLPDWASLDPSTGVITGVPTEPGTHQIRVTARDSVGQEASSVSLDLIVVGPLDLGPASLPTGTPNVPYQVTLIPSGGQGPYVLRILAGSLPPGISFDPAAGTFSGTTSQSGSFPLIVEVCDAFGLCVSRPYVLEISTLAPVILADPPDGVVGKGYFDLVSVIDGTGPFTYAVVAGSLPPGLTLNADGTLGGQPTQIGSFLVTFQVTDSQGRTSTATVVITIEPAPPGDEARGRPQGSGSCALASNPHGNRSWVWLLLVGVLAGLLRRVPR